MINKTTISNFIQQSDPVGHICDQEFVSAVLQVGSYVSMIENKRLNVAALFVLLFENEHYREVFMNATSCNTFQDGILSLLCLHPSLLKSKSTKGLIRKLDAKRKRELSHAD